MTGSAADLPQCARATPSAGPPATAGAWSPADTVADILAAGWRARALDVFVRLGCADRLGREELPLNRLAVLVGARADTLAPILDAVEPCGVVRQTRAGTYTLGPVGHCLAGPAGEVVGEMLPAVLINGLPLWRQAMEELTGTVRTGRAAVTDSHGGLYAYLDTHPDTDKLFDAYMASRMDRIAPLIAGHEFGDTVVDLGGGTGVLLAEILRTHPQATGVLVERRTVAQRAHAYLEGQALRGRYKVIAGNIFAPLTTGATDYILANVLFNWDDQRAGELLATVRTAMVPQSRLWLVEALAPPSGQSQSHPDREVAALRALALFGTRTRSLERYADLLRGAGLRIEGQTQPLPWGLSLITCRPAQDTPIRWETPDQPDRSAGESS